MWNFLLSMRMNRPSLSFSFFYFCQHIYCTRSIPVCTATASIGLSWRARPFLHVGGVSMQIQLCGQLVCSQSACDRHATHLQSRPARKGTHTQGVTNSRHVHAYLEPISLKIGPCCRLHAATCAGQDLGHKILWQPHD